MDNITRFLRSSLSAAGFIYPVRLSAAFGVSILIYLCINALHSDFPDVAIFRVVAQSPYFFIVALTFVIAFGRTLLGRPLASDKMSAWIDTIEEILKKSGFSRVQKNMLWQRLAERLIDSADMREEMRREKLEEISKEVIEDQKSSGGADPIAPA